MFAPQGTVWLGHVPWDSSYRHVYYEGMRNKSLIIQNFMTMESNNYTFIREDENIRVPYNADSLYGINYCMYQNDGIWFCAFVNTITYVANNTSLLHLVEDVWHTWGEYLNVKACMVAREHVNTDGLGEWRAPEPALELETVTGFENDFTDLIPDTIIVGTNAIPHLKSGQSNIFGVHSEDDFDGSDAVAGTLYGRVYSGAKYYAFSTSNLSPLSNFMRNLNLCGAAESVCALYMLSGEFLSVDSNHEISGITKTLTNQITVSPTLGGGYSPRNKKCLTFPYLSIVITDNCGGEMALKAEDCDTWGTFTAEFRQGLDPTAQAFFTPSGYMGKVNDQSHMMPMSTPPQGPWVYSSYQNWAAQNAATIQNKNTQDIFGAIGGVAVAAVGVGLAATGVGAPAGGPLAAVGMSSATAAGAGMFISGAGSALGSAFSYEGTQAQIDAQKKTPAHTVGSSSGNSLQGVSRNCGGYRVIVLQSESAQRLDFFFDLYGYQIDRVKVPNLTGRPNWNYVKTVGSNATGTIPADRLRAMNASLDSGITFWHTTDVGNYALDNRLQ